MKLLYRHPACGRRVGPQLQGPTLRQVYPRDAYQTCPHCDGSKLVRVRDLSDGELVIDVCDCCAGTGTVLKDEDAA